MDDAPNPPDDNLLTKVRIIEDVIGQYHQIAKDLRGVLGGINGQNNNLLVAGALDGITFKEKVPVFHYWQEWWKNYKGVPDSLENFCTWLQKTADRIQAEYDQQNSVYNSYQASLASAQK